MPSTHLIIFSDLDGTLLDTKNYSYEKAQPALRSIKKSKIPLVLCSSKTRSELEFYRNLLENSDPFIVENGGGIYIPKDYLPFPIDFDRVSSEYFVIDLGVPYKTIVKTLNGYKKKGISLRGFSDMTAEEISSICNIPLDQARLAKQREYDEPFLILEDRRAIPIEDVTGIRCTQGDRFYHLSSRAYRFGFRYRYGNGGKIGSRYGHFKGIHSPPRHRAQRC